MDIKGLLPPEVGALVKKSMEAAKRDAYRARKTEGGDCSKMEQKSDSAESSAERQAKWSSRFTNVDALTALATAYLAAKPRPGRTPGRYEVLIHIDVERLAAGNRPPWLRERPRCNSTSASLG